MHQVDLWTRYPIIGLSGWSGAGKTTLIEALIPRLRSAGLRVAVAKHDAHGMQIDQPGKDSYRFFEAGASVVLTSPGERLCRYGVAQASLESTVLSLLSSHDVVLLEGHKGSPFPKLWLQGPEAEEPPSDTVGLLDVIPRGEHRVDRVFPWLMDRIRASHLRPPRFGGVFVGGRSRRMGTAKHRLLHRGKTWLDLSVDALSPHVDQVVLLGSGGVEGSQWVQLPDAPGSVGPMAGILSAFRWAPWHDWVFAACDLPNIDSDAVDWLLRQRAPGTWAVVPRTAPQTLEPLFASYSFRCGPVFEELNRQGLRAPRHITRHPATRCPTVPNELRHAWLNVNDPAERERLLENSA